MLLHKGGFVLIVIMLLMAFIMVRTTFKNKERNCCECANDGANDDEEERFSP